MEARAERLKTLVLPIEVKPKRKRTKTMATDVIEMKEAKNSNTKVVTAQVFDLKQFDNITLGKEIQLPAKPGSLSEAVEQFGNDQERLLNVIYEGMIQEATKKAEEDESGYTGTGWHEFGDEGELENEEYVGKYADSKKKDVINGMILNFAKVLGFNKSMTRDEKRAARDRAKAAIRSNDAMMAQIAQ
jgi:hypothetical protein